MSTASQTPMNKQQVIQKVKELGIVPVIRAQSADEAMQTIDAIIAGGIDVLEITMTVPNAVALISEVVKKCGEKVLVGAGTVLNPESAKACIVAGARFIVSPALNLDTIAFCKKQDVMISPGCLTPTEVLTAWNAGADIIKVFPCQAMGGASYVKALKGPFPDIPLLPTGGVNLQTIGDFIKAGSEAVGVGTELVDLKAIRAGNSTAVTEKAKQYVEQVRLARS